ncbi:methanol dehydrogenase regulatory protein [Legionella pneumophila]|nr:methanol dehydrogenase regulatory protein [Legionella pneumophila]
MAFIMIKQLQQALSDILLGKEEVIRLGITCLLANGHLLSMAAKKDIRPFIA